MVCIYAAGGVEPLFYNLVVREQAVAAETHFAGTMAADSLDGMDTGSVIEFGCGRNLPDHCRGTVAR